MVEVLTSLGCDVNVKDSASNTPLHLAAGEVVASLYPSLFLYMKESLFPAGTPLFGFHETCSSRGPAVRACSFHLSM